MDQNSQDEAPSTQETMKKVDFECPGLLLPFRRRNHCRRLGSRIADFRGGGPNTPVN